MAEPSGRAGPEDAILTHWKMVLQQMPAGVILARAPDAKAIFQNDAAEQILGESRRGAGGRETPRRWRGFRPNGQPYGADEYPLVRAIREGASIEGEEIEVLRGDGSRAVIYANAAPIRDGSGEVIAAVMTFSDITDRRRIESKRRFLTEAGAALAGSLDYLTTIRNVARLAVPTLADWCAIDVVDGNGRLERIAVEHADPGKDDLARHLAALPFADPSLQPGLGETPRGGGLLFPEVTDALLVALARDQEQLEALRRIGARSAMVVPLSAREHALGQITLIAAESDRRYDVDELELVQELALHAGLAIDNARLYQQSQSANRAKADFLSIISHELRTPLTAVIGYAELLALGIPDPITERQAEQVERIEIAAQHLLQLIEEILTIINLEAGTVSVRRQPVRLSSILRRAEAIARPMAMEKSLRLHFEPAEEVDLVTDPDKLLQVFLNLLSNAVKFTNQGSVRVTVRRGEGCVEVAVHDTGIGLSAEEKELVFDAFWQAEQPITRRAGGTGLGLTISQRLMGLLGGEVVVQSEPGKGSTFAARIPLGA